MTIDYLKKAKYLRAISKYNTDCAMIMTNDNCDIIMNDVISSQYIYSRVYSMF